MLSTKPASEGTPETGPPESSAETPPKVRAREWLALIAIPVALDYLLYQGPGGLSDDRVFCAAAAAR